MKPLQRLHPAKESMAQLWEFFLECCQPFLLCSFTIAWRFSVSVEHLKPTTLHPVFLVLLSKA
jgi:hypothetical protein